jgi:hypothetical protein
MKHLLRGAALVALFAIFEPALAQAPNATSTPPSSNPAPAASEKAAAPDTAASNSAQPRPKRHVRRSHRYARPHSPPYGSPYYWDYRWMSPADHAANDLNAGIVYGNGWGWGWGPYGRTTDSYN